MSESDDRIPVPVNGHHPTESAAAPTLPSQVPEAPPDLPAATIAPDPRIVVSPTQLAIGFGIVASVLALLVGRARRRRG
jgi:hypothetical protein